MTNRGCTVTLNINNQGRTIVKLNYTAALMGALALGLGTQSNATEHHTAQALEHSAMAAAHGQDGHAD